MLQCPPITLHTILQVPLRVMLMPAKVLASSLAANRPSRQRPVLDHRKRRVVKDRLDRMKLKRVGVVGQMGQTRFIEQGFGHEAGRIPFAAARIAIRVKGSVLCSIWG